MEKQVSSIVFDIFKNKKINPKNLLKFGFREENNTFLYSGEILDGDFCVQVKIKAPDEVETKTIERETGEIYSLHLTDTEGNFVGKVREEYKNFLFNIAENCFDSNIFKSEQANKVIEYIKEKYGSELEFLWEKFSDNAIARRQDNKKWYLALLVVQKEKLGAKSKEKVEIIDLRAEPDKIAELIKKEYIYSGYHMNKKHWITVILDGSCAIDEIYNLIDKSYILALKKA